MARELYRRVDDQRPPETVKENEVRVTAGGKQRAVITYAVALLEERQAKEITIRALGQAIYKAVGIVEIVKRRVPGLHQLTQLDSVDTVEKYEPTEEGLDPIVQNRTVSSIIIRLSVTAPADTNQPGYQPPLAESQVRGPARSNDRGRARGRGRGRGRYSTYTQLNSGTSTSNTGGDTSSTQAATTQSPPVSSSTSSAPIGNAPYAPAQGEDQVGSDLRRGQIRVEGEVEEEVVEEEGAEAEVAVEVLVVASAAD